MLHLLAAGKANRRVVAELADGESRGGPTSVASCAKLGVQSRTQAALYAAHTGQVTVEWPEHGWASGQATKTGRCARLRFAPMQRGSQEGNA